MDFLHRLVWKICDSRFEPAVVISSLIFVIGHIVNLLHGAELLPTLLQLCYATAAIFHRWSGLWPCIVTHSLLNALSAIEGPHTFTQGIYVWYTPMQE